MSVPCEIKVYIRIGAQRCGSHRQPGARADRILKMAGTKRFLTAYINRARLDKTVTPSFYALFPRVKIPPFSNESLITSEILSFLRPVSLLVTFTPMNILSLARIFKLFFFLFFPSFFLDQLLDNSSTI